MAREWQGVNVNNPSHDDSKLRKPGSWNSDSRCDRVVDIMQYQIIRIPYY